MDTKITNRHQTTLNYLNYEECNYIYTKRKVLPDLCDNGNLVRLFFTFRTKTNY